MSAREIVEFLRQTGLIGADDSPAAEPLTGGVSSDIWKIETAGGPVCVKRALAQLKTEKEWFAPVERNANEADWIRTAARIVPGAAPEILAEDRDAVMFAMRYLEPADYPVWKTQLLGGEASAETAAAVGDALGQIHAATAGDPAIAARFATDDIFHAIRIEPYLLRTADACPDVAPRLTGLAEVTANTREVLVHGDVSPKNILVGANGPVLLDAECAWYGDPAFDLAFCLNHLLLKSIHTPSALDGYLDCYDRLAAAYAVNVIWEPADTLDRRTAELLPGLLLARIDGASPVEYITDTDARNTVRRVARITLQSPPSSLHELRETFRKETTP